MPLPPLPTLPVGLILTAALLSGCGTPNVGRVVVAPSQAKPPIPLPLKVLPPAATLDWEGLVLSAFGPSETPD